MQKVELGEGGGPGVMLLATTLASAIRRVKGIQHCYYEPLWRNISS